MENERSYWLTVMRKIADPVLLNLEKETLIREIPTDFHPDRKLYIALEAFGRTLQGIAPWLEVTGLTGKEATEQEKMRFVARRALENAVNPASPDYMNFSGGYGQPLVDAAFLSHAVVRAPRELYDLMLSSFRSVEDVQETPGATPVNCGHYLMHNLEMAKWYAREFAAYLEANAENSAIFEYPQATRPVTEDGQHFFDS